MSQDYMMRLFRQFALVLAAIIAKRKGGKNEEALQELAAQCPIVVGLSLDTVKQLSPDALANQILSAGSDHVSRSAMLAELLLEDGEIHEALGQPVQAMPSYLHAFCLLSDALPALNPEEHDHYHPKLQQLITKVAHLPPNPYTTERLRAWQKSGSA